MISAWESVSCAAQTGAGPPGGVPAGAARRACSRWASAARWASASRATLGFSLAGAAGQHGRPLPGLGVGVRRLAQQHQVAEQQHGRRDDDPPRRHAERGEADRDRREDDEHPQHAAAAPHDPGPPLAVRRPRTFPGARDGLLAVVRPRRPPGVAALRLALRVPLTGALLAQVLLGRPAVRPDRCGGVELRAGGASDGLIRGALRRWRGTRAAEARVPGPAVVAETGPRARLTRVRHGVPPTGEPAQPQMAVTGVIVPEPPGNDHANPDRHDGGVQNGAAHGPSPRRGRCRADRGRPGDRSTTRVSPGRKRARRVRGNAGRSPLT